jgi:hemerythrin superfamily protein
MADNVIDVLKQEHDEIRQLLSKAQKDPQQFAQLADEVSRHSHAEEEAFYQPLKDEKSLHEMILEGYEEHHVVEMVVQEMQDQKVGSDVWQAKFEVMTENLEHHLEEEEKELFPAAQKIVKGQRSEEMAQAYERAEHALVGSGRS